MESFLYYLLRASVLMALFYGFYKLLFARTTFHSMNRVMLLIIAFISSLLPVFRFNFLPEKKVDPILLDSSLIDFSTMSMTEAAALTPSLSIPWIPLLMGLFVVGLLFTITRYLIGLGQITLLIRRSEKHLLDDGTVLCVSNQPISPFSWMKYVVLSEEDFSAEHHTILRHEKAHIRLHHSMDMICFDLFTCLFWFNPFSWLLRREIQSVHEYQADARVLEIGVDPKQYQLLLIRKSVGEQKFALANNFRQRDLHQRIIMMMKNRTNNRMKWNYALTLPVLMLAMIALSVPKLNAKGIEKEQEKTADKTAVVLNQVSDTIRIEFSDLMDLEMGATSLKDSTGIDSKENVKFAISGTDVIKNKPLIFIDEKKVTNEKLNELNPNNIESISILKDKSAIDLYGEDGKDGVILITLKNNNKLGDNLTSAKGLSSDSIKSVVSIGGARLPDSLRGNVKGLIIRSKEDVLIESALYIIDDEKMDSEFDVSSIDPQNIESISVLKDKSAVDLYGEEGKNGVVIINLKKADNKPVE